MFQSRYRAASHFRTHAASRAVSLQLPFQSRYRAASHFRFRGGTFHVVLALVVSISLSSGFSFQVSRRHLSCRPCACCFNLVIERLLISGLSAAGARSWSYPVSISLSSGFSFQATMRSRRSAWANSRFNLVIERLLISGQTVFARKVASHPVFQSRYRAASHFRRQRKSDGKPLR